MATNPFAFIIAHTSAFMIAVCCAVNAYYFLSLSTLAPFIAIPCAISGFILNYLLYTKDHEDFAKTLSNFLTEFASKPIEYIIALLASALQAMFTYDIWSKLLQTAQIQALLIPSYFPALFSIAFFFGTFILLGHALTTTSTDQGEEISSWKLIWRKTTDFLFKSDSDLKHKAAVFFGLVVTSVALYSLFLYTYLPSTLSVLMQFFPQLTGLARCLTVFALFFSIILCEIPFNFKAVGRAFGVTYDQERKSIPSLLNPSTIVVGLIILMNAIGNGFIGIGESALGASGTLFLICNLVMSALINLDSNLDGNKLSFSHHLQSIKNVPNASSIIPLTWLIIASLWLLPSFSLSTMSFTIITGILTFLSMTAKYSLETAPVENRPSGYPEAATPIQQQNPKERPNQSQTMACAIL